MIFTTTIPGPPVPKGRPRVVRNRKTGKMHGVTPPRTRRYESSAALIIRAAASVQRWKCTSEPVELEVRVYRHQLRGDLDNFVKAVEDSANGILWDDDSQVVKIDAAMFLDRKRPRTEVTVRLAAGGEV